MPRAALALTDNEARGVASGHGMDHSVRSEAVALQGSDDDVDQTAPPDPVANNRDACH